MIAKNKTAVVITTISHSDNAVLMAYADGCKEHGFQLYVAGDLKTPKDFSLSGCEYLSIENQKSLPFQLASLLPDNHYSKKNLAYLQAIKNGCDVLLETDDDNIPLDSFWSTKHMQTVGEIITFKGWFNVYRSFSDGDIWPRGFPLKQLEYKKDYVFEENAEAISPIQQFLADENPDVDAVYRLSSPLPVYFKKRSPVLLDINTVCPFNSQNTVWFKEAFVLLYLPSTCSFRMCDIWRSLVAQRILWENDWLLSFHEATVIQKRNEHDLQKDLEDEIAGYLFNEQIMKELSLLKLEKGVDFIAQNLILCYKMLVENDFLESIELQMLEAWVEDYQSILQP